MIDDDPPAEYIPLNAKDLGLDTSIEIARMERENPYDMTDDEWMGEDY